MSVTSALSQSADLILTRDGSMSQRVCLSWTINRTMVIYSKLTTISAMEMARPKFNDKEVEKRRGQGSLLDACLMTNSQRYNSADFPLGRYRLQDSANRSMTAGGILNGPRCPPRTGFPHKQCPSCRAAGMHSLSLTTSCNVGTHLRQSFLVTSSSCSGSCMKSPELR